MSAIERVKEYVNNRNLKPISALGDGIHSIHLGTEWAAELHFSDLCEVVSQLSATESERKHWEMTAGTFRTDLEYMTRERDEYKSALQSHEGHSHDLQVSFEKMRERAETAERDLAEARAKLAQYERWQGDAEKVASFVLCGLKLGKDPNIAQKIIDDAARHISSFAAQAVAAEREEIAKWHDEQAREHWHTHEECAAAIRRSAQPIPSPDAPT